MVRNKSKDFGKTADIRGPKAESEAVRSNGSINSEPQERLKENR
jgi:small acid-soluble spore protein K (minor)